MTVERLHVMNLKLPPPDPFESLGMAPQHDLPMEAPAAVYLGASPTPEVKRLSSQILDLRPGALIVVAPQALRGQTQH